ncbi:SPW repeat protein [Nitrobacter sp.]|uniref:SPW repeat protein n=1 Tax=Nitrobacter sp. TaxID=29420 RepID=UPI003F649279
MKWKWRRESILDVYNLVLALVLFVTPWFLARATATTDLDLWASAAAIGAISVIALLAFSWWTEWVNLLLGFWLIASPWVLGFAHTRAMHFSIGIGVVVAFLSALEIWLVYDKEDETRHLAQTEQDRPLFH